MVIPAIGEKVLAGMRGNPDFPDPPVSMEILEQALGEFSLAIQAQAKGGTLATAIRNNARRKKNKRKKRHAVSIGRPICGVFQLLRRRIMQSVLCLPVAKVAQVCRTPSYGKHGSQLLF